jgi:anti-sigma factor RsiW
MTVYIDDSTLAAYVDGELDPAQLREIDLLLASDPQARLKVRRMRETTALLRAACAESHFQDVPDRLLALVEKRPARTANPWLRRMLAASVLLASLVGTDLILEHVRKPENVATLDSREAMLDEIAAYHLVYARQTEHLVEVPAERREHIEAWLGSLLNRTLRVPDLSSQGLKFEGARLLAIDTYPVAQLLWSREHGDPVALCVTFGSPSSRPLDIEHHRGLNVGSWDQDGYTYVVVGAITEDSVRRIAAKVDTGTGTGIGTGIGVGEVPQQG